MLSIRSLLPFVSLALLAVVVAACGSDGSSTGDDNRSTKPDSKHSSDEVDPGSAEGVEARTGAAGIAITPALRSCMSKAGFTQDATPVTGATASWRGNDGAQIVVAPSPEAARTIAGDVGTTTAPASVDRTRVSAGPPALTSAAAACLDA
ncbi:MAG: hypothetical protein JWL76_1271 [Thermoleophilia bacterium]|nr:hypothetical protein [Thermoleophilia bacterium]